MCLLRHIRTQYKSWKLMDNYLGKLSYWSTSTENCCSKSQVFFVFLMILRSVEEHAQRRRLYSSASN